MYKLIFRGFLALAVTSFVSYKILISDVNLASLERSVIKELTVTITNDLDKAMPLILQAGYKVFSIQAQLSLPPKVTAIFELDHIVTRKKQEVILKALDDNTVGKLVLMSLMQAFAIDETISIRNMELKKINVVIGLPPSVTVDYR